MNHLKTLLKAILFTFAFFVFVQQSYAKTQVVKLVTEYHVNPIGIDIKIPRLSWQILSE